MEQVRLDGLYATMSLPGSVNTEVFVTYVREILAPQLWMGAFVVMDNLPVHKAHRIQEIITAVGESCNFLTSKLHQIYLPLSCAGQN